MAKEINPYLRYVMIEKTKYGDFYYDGTGEMLHLNALRIIRQRVDNGMYNKYPERDEPPLYSPEEIEKIEATGVKLMIDKMRHDIASKQISINWTRGHNEACDEAARVLETKDGEAALRFLRSRDEYQYEEIQIERLL